VSAGIRRTTAVIWVGGIAAGGTLLALVRL